MTDKTNISSKKQKLLVYLILIVTTFAVFWQVHHYDFINFDDHNYVTQNHSIQSGITSGGLFWALSTFHTGYWHPITWLSLMFDYNLSGLNAGGYHLTNLFLHILNTLLLFWLLCRMTQKVWESAFVAGFFALHPFHVESVAWIAERKDVLSAFFWMLTLCLYVYYTEKPVIIRYLLVLFSFVLALMSKPMVVTLPLIMVLLDYWPLKRFELKKHNLVLWQLREKTPFFILSAVISFITFYAQYNLPIKHFPLGYRLANAPVSFVTYLEKTLWPHDLAIFYPFPDQFSVWQVSGATILIIVISVTVILTMRRLPYLFVGWLWYVMTLLPVIGLIQSGEQAMADRYHYLPSIGIAVVLAWGLPSLMNSEKTRKKILFPVAIIVLTVMAVLTWQQCGYWKNSATLFNHALRVTEDNYLAHNARGITFGEMGQYERAIEDFNKSIKSRKDYADAYSNKGFAYYNLGEHQQAINNYNEAIRLRPDRAIVYYNRALVYTQLGQYLQAFEDYSKAISLKADYVEAYTQRAFAYLNHGYIHAGCQDAKKACELGKCTILEDSNDKGLCR